jgi:hypothetical protein
VAAGHLGQGGQGVEGGGGVRGGLDAAGLGRDPRPQRLHDLGLARDDALVRLEDLLLVLLQLGGDEALAPRDRLLADVVVRDGAEVRFADLDVVAEDAVETDLQGRDPRAGTLPLLDGGDGGAPAVADLAQRVQLRVHARAHHAALAQGGRGLVHHRRLDVLRDVERGIEVLELGAHERGLTFLDRGRGLRQRAQRAGQRAQVARRRRAQADPSHDAVEVLDVAQHLAQAGALDRAERELLHRVQPVLDRLQRGQRTQQPLAQAARAHGRARQVQHVEQRAPARSVHRVVHQLQVAAGQRVDDEAVLRGARAQARHVVEVALLRLAQVAQGGGPGGDGGGRGVAPEGFEGQDPEVGQQLATPAARVEHGRVQLRARDRAFGRGGVGQPCGEGGPARHEELAWPRGPEVVAQAFPGRRPFPLRDLEFAGGGVDPGRPEGGRAGGQGEDESGLRRVQGGGLELGAGGHDAHDLALDHALGRARVLHLLAEGDAEALLDQPSHVGGDGVMGDSAHRDRVALAVLRARGERDLQGTCGHHRVLEEELVEVAHAEEEQGVRVLRLHPVVLLHGRRQGLSGHRG